MDLKTGSIQSNGIYTEETNSVSNSVSQRISRTKINSSYAKDNFVKTGATSAPKKSSGTTIPFLSQYSPKLLLRVYNNSDFIELLMSKNPKVSEKLKSVGVENPVINTRNVSDMYNTHITTTKEYALQIANEMGLSSADKKILEEAAVFHDFGKVLIPKEILNKSGKLDDKERKIIDTHSEIGANLLETAGMNKRVTNIIRNHHNPDSRDLLCNILSVADIYSALREKRSYKNPMSNKEAFIILDQKAQNGEVSTEVVNTLKQIQLINRNFA